MSSARENAIYSHNVLDIGAYGYTTAPTYCMLRMHVTWHHESERLWGEKGRGKGEYKERRKSEDGRGPECAECRGDGAAMQRGYKLLVALSFVTWALSLTLFSALPQHNENGALPIQLGEHRTRKEARMRAQSQEQAKQAALAAQAARPAVGPPVQQAPSLPPNSDAAPGATPTPPTAVLSKPLKPAVPIAAPTEQKSAAVEPSKAALMPDKSVAADAPLAPAVRSEEPPPPAKLAAAQAEKLAAAAAGEK